MSQDWPDWPAEGPVTVSRLLALLEPLAERSVLSLDRAALGELVGVLWTAAAGAGALPALTFGPADPAPALVRALGRLATSAGARQAPLPADQRARLTSLARRLVAGDAHRPQGPPPDGPVLVGSEPLVATPS
jgi:hypothetical protein